MTTGELSKKQKLILDFNFQNKKNQRVGKKERQKKKNGKKTDQKKRQDKKRNEKEGGLRTYDFRGLLEDI